MSGQCRGWGTTDRCGHAVYRLTLSPRNSFAHLWQIRRCEQSLLVVGVGMEHVARPTDR
jgi:hypothetical protein